MLVVRRVRALLCRRIDSCTFSNRRITSRTEMLHWSAALNKRFRHGCMIEAERGEESVESGADFGLWIFLCGLRTLDPWEVARCRLRTSDFELQTSDFGSWRCAAANFGLRILRYGLRTSDLELCFCKLRTSEFGIRTSDFGVGVRVLQTSDF